VRPLSIIAALRWLGSIFCEPMADPPVGGRSVGNELVSIGLHPFFVFGEAPEGLGADGIP
jgi:hypothetical protein